MGFRQAAVSAFLFLTACASSPPKLPEQPPAASSAWDVAQAPTYQPKPAPKKRFKPALVAGIFPKPPELEPQVAFWRKVYTKWGQDQVVIHDDRYLNLVYQVVRLPGPVSDGYYTPEQKAFLEHRLAYWRERLKAL